MLSNLYLLKIAREEYTQEYIYMCIYKYKYKQRYNNKKYIYIYISEIISGHKQLQDDFMYKNKQKKKKVYFI